MLGVHFAITSAQASALLAAAGDDEEVGEFLEELEESWAEDELKVDTDQAWKAIDRCLARSGYPLSHAVLGGDHLHGDYYVVYVEPAEVQDVATALLSLDELWLRARLDTDDFDYVWPHFSDVRAFYQRAAASGRAVLFTAT
ncbi:DUF1877 family protein [Cryptosporangium sp. NPDC048952]|uniref:DUF1877 family protein n=1 Tax=Cryptosporangium sp. NPDC048952 TaxID=3363961 RepID=UPI003718DC66